MNRLAVSMLLLLATTASVMAADRLWLKDGRDLRGRVLLRGEDVLLIDGQRARSFPGHTVKRIDSQQPAEALIDRQTRPAGPSSETAAEWFSLARWMDALQLSDQAREAYRNTLKQDPNHAQAHQALGNVRIGKQWMSWQTALSQARQQLTDGQAQHVIDVYLPAIESTLRSSEDRLAAEHLAIDAHLQTLDFATARQYCLQLASHASDPDRTRCAVLAEILGKHPDGVVVLDAPWPPAASLLNTPAAIQPGPASLSQPDTRDAAWHARARDVIAQAQTLLEQTTETLLDDNTEPAAAQETLDQISALFERAEALSPDIAQPYRHEHEELTLALHRLRVDRAADDFDQRLDALWGTPQADPLYTQLIDALLRDIDRVEEHLQAISDIIERNPGAYPDEQTQTQSDLLLLRQLQKVLAHERYRATQQVKEADHAS